MKVVTILLAVAAVGGAFRYVSRRLATHQRVIPNPLGRVNTRVHRINQ